MAYVKIFVCLFVLGISSTTYAEEETDNLELAQMIANILGKELKYEMVDFHSQRPGHDLRYALDGSKMKEKGWNHPVPFKESLKKTIEWTLENERWLNI